MLQNNDVFPSLTLLLAPVAAKSHLPGDPSSGSV
jgi:hypothetical protein